MNVREALRRVMGMGRNEQIDTLADWVKNDPKQLGAQADVVIHRYGSGMGYPDGGCPVADRRGEGILVGTPGNYRIQVNGGEWPISDECARSMGLVMVGEMPGVKCRLRRG